MVFKGCEKLFVKYKGCRLCCNAVQSSAWLLHYIKNCIILNVGDFKLLVEHIGLPLQNADNNVGAIVHLFFLLYILLSF